MIQIENWKMLTHRRSSVIDNVTYVHPNFIKMQPTGSK